MRHAPTDQSITWVYTPDLAATCAFYADKLGLSQVHDQGQCRLFRWSPTSFLGVCQVRPGRHVEPRGVVITLVTDDVDGWYRALQADGVATEGPPRRSEVFDVYAFFALDPNGYRLEFQTFLDPSWKRATAGSAQA